MMERGRGVAMMERGRGAAMMERGRGTAMMERGRGTAMMERGRETAIELGEPVFEETLLSRQMSSDEPFITSTLISSDHTHSLTQAHRHHITSPPTENYDFSGPPMLSDFRSPPTLSDEFSLPPIETHDVRTSGPLSSSHEFPRLSDNISSGPPASEDLTGPPTLQPLAPQPPADLTGPSSLQSVVPQPPADLIGPPQRSVAPQPPTDLTGPPQRSLDDGRVPPKVSNGNNQDTEYLDVREKISSLIHVYKCQNLCQCISIVIVNVKNILSRKLTPNFLLPNISQSTVAVNLIFLPDISPHAFINIVVCFTLPFLANFINFPKLWGQEGVGN